jgi:hypothetical protein
MEAIKYGCKIQNACQMFGVPIMYLHNHFYMGLHNLKNRQNMCITKRKGEHTCFACEESASNWASNHTHTIQIEGGQNYTK